jgi:hypothetical protein
MWLSELLLIISIEETALPSSLFSLKITAMGGFRVTYFVQSCCDVDGVEVDPGVPNKDDAFDIYEIII